MRAQRGSERSGESRTHNEHFSFFVCTFNYYSLCWFFDIYTFLILGWCAISANVADIRTSEIYNEVNKLKKLGERRATKRAVYPLLVPPSEARVQRGRGLKVRRSRTHNNNLFLSNLILFLAFYYDGS